MARIYRPANRLHGRYVSVSNYPGMDFGKARAQEETPRIDPEKRKYQVCQDCLIDMGMVGTGKPVAGVRGVYGEYYELGVWCHVCETRKQCRHEVHTAAEIREGRKTWME